MSTFRSLATQIYLLPIGRIDLVLVAFDLHQFTVLGHNLLRKEVIQPHLPIRLPCYDFTLVIDPTFDSCLFR